MKVRVLAVIGALALALSMVIVTLAVAQGDTAAAAPQTPSVTPAIVLTKTVGIDPNVCAGTDTITVTSGTQVTYCYEVENTGGITLTRHTLDDSELGGILNDFPYSLVPGASAFITESAIISSSVVNDAIWTAYNPGPTDLITATDSATVTVELVEPAIVLTKTVGLDPGLCATTDALTVPAGTNVTYCYEVTNTGGITLTLHDLEDSELGALLTVFGYPLVPGASAFLTETTNVTATVINTATWTAYNPGPVEQVTAMDTATVTVTQPLTPSITLTKTVGTNPNACAQSDDLTVTSGTAVTYCYEVTNTGPVTLTVHNLNDSALGPLLTDFDYNLAPGASAFITETIALTETVINTATWTASNPGPTDVISATDTATVTVTAAPVPDIFVQPNDVAVEAQIGEQTMAAVQVINFGPADLIRSVSEAAADCAATSDLPWFTVNPLAGTNAGGTDTELTLTFDAAGLAPGAYSGVLCITSNDPDEPMVTVPLAFTVVEYILHLPYISGSPLDGSER